jgi:LysB family phage lysis regulatory protein
MTQLRLYLALGLAAAFLGLAALAFWYRGEAISASAEAASARKQLATATEANRQANAAIDALQEQARMDSRLTASLVEEMRKVSDGLAEQSAKLTDLEKTNAALADYLNAPVPADLRKLYDH